MIDWPAMLLVILAVGCFSRGWTLHGNIFQIFSTIAWAVIALRSDFQALYALQFVLAGIAGYALGETFWRRYAK